MEDLGRVREGGGFHGGVCEALGGELVAREGRVGGEGGERGANGVDMEVVDGGAGRWLFAWFGETGDVRLRTLGILSGLYVCWR